MFRPTPLWLLLCFGAVFPISCSSDEDDNDTADSANASGGGLSLGTGGDSGDGDGAGGNSVITTEYCEEFRGLGTCGSDAITATRNPVNILLVIDKSGSMDGKPDPDSASTLWQATTSALKAALNDANDNVHFGLQTYPKNVPLDCYPDCCAMPDETDDGVTVPVGEGDDHRDTILTTLDRTSPGGGTPTAEALARAYQYFSSGAGEELEGDRFVLLATDGGPNCHEGLKCEADACTLNIDGNCDLPNDENCCEANSEGCLDDSGTLDQIKLLRGIGVDTFVVGLSGSEEYASQLDAFADAGGRARSNEDDKYYKVGAEGSSDGLKKVLNKITKSLVQSCDVQLGEAPKDPNKLNVAVDCDVVPRGSKPADLGEGGETSQADEPSSWDLDNNTSPPTVRLRGAICDTIETKGVERVDIVSGCPTVR